MTNQTSENKTEKALTLTRLLTPLVNLWRVAGWYLLGGFIGSVLLLLLFAELTEDVFSKEFTTLDNNFELWLHEHASAELDVFFNVFTTVGGVAGIAILTVITFGLLWYLGKLSSAWVLVLAVGGGLAINQVLKLLFRRPRPELWAITGHYPTTFSFPSGHSTVSLCYFGVLAWLGWRSFKPILLRLSWIALMGLIIGLVGLSRIYFGVHYPTDVIAGYLSGGFWLVVILNSAAVIQRFRRRSEAKAPSV